MLTEYIQIESREMEKFPPFFKKILKIAFNSAMVLHLEYSFTSTGLPGARLARHALSSVFQALNTVVVLHLEYFFTSTGLPGARLSVSPCFYYRQW